MYVFKPVSTTATLKSEIPLKTYPIYGEYLRDIPVLPDTISSDVEEFRVEAWMRLDRRIRLADITSRMHPDFRIHSNALQQRGVRFRKAFFMLAWGSGNKKTDALEAEILRAMEKRGVDPALNSTRGLTPGLINPDLGEAGGRIPVPRQYAQKEAADRKSVAAAASVVDAQATPLVGSPAVEVAAFPAPPPAREKEDMQQKFINPALLLQSLTNAEPIDFGQLQAAWDLPFPALKPNQKKNRILKRSALFPKPTHRHPQRNTAAAAALLDKFGGKAVAALLTTNARTRARPRPPSEILPLHLRPRRLIVLSPGVSEQKVAEIWSETLEEYYFGVRAVVEMPHLLEEEVMELDEE